MLGNTKPKGGKPQAPPPTPKPQKIEVEDVKLTNEDVARMFGIPSHLLEQAEEVSLAREAAKEIGLEFITRWELSLKEYCDELDKASAEIERRAIAMKIQNSVAGSNPAGGD